MAYSYMELSNGGLEWFTVTARATPEETRNPYEVNKKYIFTLPKSWVDNN